MDRRALAERDAIHAWIREDVPLAGKMNLMPRHVDALLDRLAALRVEPQDDVSGEQPAHPSSGVVLRQLSEEERTARATALADALRRERSGNRSS